MEKIKAILIQLAESVQKQKKVVLALSCLVVFITTYLLILPAFTLTQEKASEQGGIDVSADAPAIEETAEEADAQDSEEVSDAEDAADENESDAIEAAKNESNDAKDSKSENESEGDQAEEAAQDEKADSEPIVYKGDGYTVMVDDPAGILPKGTTVEVEELLEKPDADTKEERKAKEEEYKNYYDLTTEAVNDGTAASGAVKKAAKKSASNAEKKEISFVKFYDIKLISGGEEIQPDKPVNIKITYDKAQQKDLKVDEKKDVKVIHFLEDEKTGEITPEILDEKNVDVTLEQKKMAETTFEAESFSVYAVVYTVDFEYVSDVDGKTYEYSMNGGDSIKLSELLPIIGVVKDDEDTVDIDEVAEFISQIAELEFSNPELISVKKEDSDWTLTSLAPFDTEETLTITMKNGDVFTVKVTDAVVPSIDDVDSNKGYAIYVERNDGFYVLKNDRTTVRVNSVSDMNKLGKDYLWRFEGSQGNYSVHPYGTEEPSTLRIHDGQWGVDPISSHTNYLRIDSDGEDHYISGYSSPKYYLNLNDWSNNFEISHWDSTEVKLWDEGRYFFTVSSNDPHYGTVSGKDSEGDKVNGVGSYTTITKTKNQNNEYKNNYSIKATPAVGYTFDHWELDGVALDKTQYPIELADGAVNINHFGSELKAVFVKTQAPPSEQYPAHDTPGYEVLSWLGDALSAKPVEGADKTAEVYDYENRIYRVDLSGHSGVQVIRDDIDLGFVTDISNSMLFPETLSPCEDSQGNQLSISYNNTNLQGQLEYLVSQGKLEHRGINNPYILIGDIAKSSTQYAVFYSSGQTLNNHYFAQGWYALDASYYARWMAGVLNYSDVQDRFKSLSSTNSLHKNDQLNQTTYVVYEPNDFWENSFIDSDYLYAHDPDNKFGANRLYYLVGSVKMALGYLQDLAQNYPLGTVYSGLETFAGSTSTDEQTIIDKTVGEENTWGTRHQDFVQIGGANNTGANYDANLASIIGKLTNINTADGTAQDIAIQQMKNILHWSSGSNTKKYVIMVTDGAPNRRKKENSSTVDMDPAEVASRINAEKEAGGSLDGATLITIGLGINDVPGGQQLLHDVADDGLYYNAQSGNDLTLILLDIIRSLMVEAAVTSDVHDVVDPAFYPVDKNTGKPVELNWKGEAYIDLEGNVLQDIPADGKCGVITYKNNQWQVDWNDQVFKPDDKGGWNGTLYVKAKEDFLGGVGINTNLGDASITPEKYFVADENGNPTGTGFDIPTPGQDEEDKRTPVNLETPRVNVDELMLTEADTEWTVYLNTSVSPRDAIKELYKEIKVQEVVTDSTNNMNSGQTVYTIVPDSTDDNTSPVSGRDPEEFSLSDIPNMGMNDIDWDKLFEDGVIDNIPYSYQGHDAGHFKIELVKEIADGANSIDNDSGTPLAHNTNKTGDEVEKYTLRVTYVPSSDNITEHYHTGSHGSGSSGNLTDEAESTNTHIINVFVKGLQITKTDLTHQILTGAKFALYRTARTTDKSTAISTPEGLTGDYVKVADLDTSSSGVALLDEVELINDNEEYYLVETVTPPGFKTRDPIEVTIEIENKFIPKPGDTEQATRPQSGIYDWTQTAKLSLDTSTGVIRTDESGDTDLTYAGYQPNSENEVMYYQIMNNPGVVLPHTGGIGTTVFYIFGSLLVLVSGTFLVSRKRAERSQNKKAS